MAATEVCSTQWMAWPEKIQDSQNKEVVKQLDQLGYHDRLSMMFKSKRAKSLTRAKSASGPGYCSYRIEAAPASKNLQESFVVPSYLLKAGNKVSLVVANQFESYGPFQSLCETRINKIRNQARLKHGDDSIIHRFENGLTLSSSATEQWSMKSRVKEYKGRFLVHGEIRNPKFQGHFYCQIQPE